jgi:hypothetical protein
MTDEAYDAQIIVRLPATLKEWVQGQARASRRSVNGQMVVWLEELQAAHEKLADAIPHLIEGAPRAAESP